MRRLALAPLLLWLGCSPAEIAPPTPGASAPGAPGGPTAPGGPVINPVSGSDAGPPPCGPSIEGPPLPCPDAGTRPPAPPPPAAPTPPPGNGPCRGPVTRQIPAWSITNSGVYVRPGDQITISATGRWRFEGGEVGPEGRGGRGGGCPDGALGLRVGKFFDRQCVRGAHSLTAARAGYLWFFQQSGNIDWSKQTGALSVTITGGDSCSGMRPEGMLGVFQDPAFDQKRLAEFEPVCGAIPVHFETDSPNDPRVRAYIADFMGGDPMAFLRKVVLVGCAANYPNPAAVPPHYRNRDMRIVHYLGARKWSDLGRAPLRVGRATYWDFDLSFRPEELEEAGLRHYGRWGAVTQTLLHEIGHVLAPDGAIGLDSGGVPRWLQETYADLVCSKFGECVDTMDNPEHWVVYGRKRPYCDGYQAGAPVLHSAEQEFPGLIHGLSSYILTLGPTRRWGGIEPIWQKLTGQSFASYYASYLTRHGATLEQPVAQCDFPAD